MLGLVRNPNTGTGAADCEGACIVAEVKHGARYRLPQWLKTEFSKAQIKAGLERYGVVVVHEPNTPYKDAFVLMRLQDFADFHNTESE